MCAVQAQDYGMAKWALALRSSHATPAAVDNAIDTGAVLRTHALRPTWHFLSADDIYWILDLTAPRILAGQRHRLKELELDSATLGRSTAIIAKALAGGNSLTREELLALIRDAGISTAHNRASHILAWAELHQVICSGAPRNGKPAYALLQERVPRAKRMTKEESLATLARRYFRSRGPATLPDFSWWSGLPLREAREGLEMVKRSLVAEPAGSSMLWSDGSPCTRAGGGVHLLPAFDEYLIGYRDRSAQLPLADQKAAVSSNGIFWPIVVAHGAVIGRWRKQAKGRGVAVTVRTFKGARVPAQSRLASALARAEEFFGARPAAEPS